MRDPVKAKLLGICFNTLGGVMHREICREGEAEPMTALSLMQMEKLLAEALEVVHTEMAKRGVTP